MKNLNRLSVYILKRYLFFLSGLSIIAFGVAFSVKASLGTSPISSVPYVVSLFTPLTVGTATIIMHCVFLVMQILILRKNSAVHGFYRTASRCERGNDSGGVCRPDR